MTHTRLLFLDGLRGILALIVFLHHFFYAFFPEIIFGGDLQSYVQSGPLSAYKIWALTPLNILFNPGTAIHFFFLISGYVQSHHYFSSNDFTFLQRSFIKRYFRLAIPTLFVLLLVFVFHQFNWFTLSLIPNNTLSGNWVRGLCPNNQKLFEVIFSGIYGSFMGKTQYYPILWTMPAELQNSFMVLILLMITHGSKHKSRLFVFWLVVQLVVFNGYYSAAFTCGLILAKYRIQSPTFVQFFSKKQVQWCCALIGLYFGSYPYTGYEQSTSHSIYYPISFFDKIPHLISFLIGSVFLLLFFLHSNKMQSIFAKKQLVWFGKLSFMFYLLHFLMLLSFTPWLYHLFAASLSRGIALSLSLIFSFILTTLLSYIFTKWIDGPTFKICDWINKKISGENQRLNNTKAAQ